MRSSSLLLSSALALALLSGAVAQGITPPGQEKKLLAQGFLSAVDDPSGETEYAITDPKGHKSHFLGKGIARKPKRDKDGNALEVGDYISAYCTPDANTGQCSSLTESDFILINRPAPPTATGVVQRVLVLLGNNPNCNVPLRNETSLEYLRVRYFGADNSGTDPGCIARQIEECSYGNLRINSAATDFFMVTPECWATDVCAGYYDIDARMRAAALAIGVDPSAYERVHHVVNAPNCGWSGAAQTPGTIVWLRGWAMDGLTPLHEMTHHYYRWHGWAATATSAGVSVEYKDGSSYMGNGYVCPSAPQLANLQWASPAVGGGAVTSAVLPLGPATSAPFMLPATYMTGAGAYVRVLPDWVPGYYLEDGATVSNTSARNLYLEVRRSMGADWRMAGQAWDGSVIIHDVRADYDLFPNVANFSRDHRSNFTGFVPPNSRRVMPAQKLVIYVGSFQGDKASVLPVYLCRYAGSDAECPTLSDVLGLPKPSAPAGAQDGT
ncbi:hypothetical protein HYH03_003748 [Edaphochlamys debaryana]|uniref:Peptidase M11 gametolysin domain-containing protein n=1 Tax=Edaphochlamys debaryana TaxID=47281 RepID=A0A835Y8Z8_9CHLO|nr:hypothetical protein HYH03_003748 [Edaphochlamys debaryana]|eukprot:KAG2498497.1 hypothetical protein HYH03_003748 [Edaphochlamys debaryana]